MTSFGSVLRSLDWSYLTGLLEQIIPAVLCIMIHEICHGAAAYALGDRTAATQGRLSLNPLHHVDWFGLVMLAVFHFGWAKPVSVNMRNFKHPKRDMAITALAGPASNFVLAALTVFLFGLFPWASSTSSPSRRWTGPRCCFPFCRTGPMSASWCWRDTGCSFSLPWCSS